MPWEKAEPATRLQWRGEGDLILDSSCSHDAVRELLALLKHRCSEAAATLWGSGGGDITRSYGGNLVDEVLVAS